MLPRIAQKTWLSLIPFLGLLFGILALAGQAAAEQPDPSDQDGTYSMSLNGGGTPTNTRLPTPLPDADAFMFFSPGASGNCSAPANGGTVQVGCRFVLNLMFDPGHHPTACAHQSVLTFPSTLIQNARVSSIGTSCVPTSTVTYDNTSFDAVFQNEVCNGPNPCVFRGVTFEPGLMVYSSGAFAIKPPGTVARAAQVGLCANAPGQAVLRWQFDPYNYNRDTEIVDLDGNFVHRPGLFTDYVINIVAPSPTPSSVIVGHVTWQGAPGQPHARQQQPVTLTVKLGTTEVNFPPQNTDNYGFFTYTLPSNLAPGTYNWRAKGPKFMANGGTVNLTGGPVTNLESGLMRAGDANNDEVVNISDFNIVRNTFGKTVGDPGYDARADFNNDNLVNALDVNLHKINQGAAVVPPIRPNNPVVPQATCPPVTPTRIPTPMFTPGPNCRPDPFPGVVEATLIEHLDMTEAVFTNDSHRCSYPIGLATYKRFDDNVEHQELFDYTLAIIPPDGTLTLTVDNPTCAYQVDAFYGDVIDSFVGGQRYGDRRLRDSNGLRTNFCTPGCEGTPVATNTPVNTNTPAATNTHTNTPTNIPTNTRTNTPVNTNTPAATNTHTNTRTNTPVNTNTPVLTNTRTNTRTSTPTNTRTNTPTDTPTDTPTSIPSSTNTPTNTQIPVMDAFMDLLPEDGAPPNGGTAVVGDRFVLELRLDTGSNNNVTAHQSYLTFTHDLIKNVRVDQIDTGCVLTSTVTPDDSTFDATLQNEVCNGPGQCNFRSLIVDPGSLAFASGASNNCQEGCGGAFRVARIGLCVIAPGQAVVHWQFSPPAPPTRDTEIICNDGALVHDPGLFLDYVFDIVTPTNTPTTPSQVLVGHVTWQSRPPQPNLRQQVPISVSLSLAGVRTVYPGVTTDANGYFTVTVAGLQTGEYTWRVKGYDPQWGGPAFLANSGTVSLSGAPITPVEMELMKTGDANNDNLANVLDFNILKIRFGQPCDPGQDPRPDFNGDRMVSVVDFNWLKINFGVGGAP